MDGNLIQDLELKLNLDLKLSEDGWKFESRFGIRIKFRFEN